MATHRVVKHVILLTLLIFDGYITRTVHIGPNLLECFMEQSVILACQQVPLASHDKTLSGLIELPFFHHFLKPVKRYIRIHDSHDLTFIVMHRHTIGGHHLHGALIVKIRLAPMTAVFGYRGGEEFHLRIVMLFRTQLHGLNAPVSPSDGIGLIQAAYLRKVVRNEGDRSAQNGRVVLHQSVCNREHPLWLIQSIAYHPRHIVNSHFHLSQLVTDTEKEGIHLALYQSVYRIVDNILR